MINYLSSYLDVAKELKKQGLLDPNDHKKMDEIYDRLADYYVTIFGEEKRLQITLYIQKLFETALL